MARRKNRGLVLVVASWPKKRAAEVLRKAHHEAAKGGGMSDRTLARIAALADPDACESPASFVAALRAAGWREKRIRTTLAELRAPVAGPLVRVARVADDWFDRFGFLVFVAALLAGATPFLAVLAVRLSVRVVAGRPLL